MKTKQEIALMIEQNQIFEHNFDVDDITESKDFEEIRKIAIEFLVNDFLAFINYTKVTDGGNVLNYYYNSLQKIKEATSKKQLIKEIKTYIN